MRQTRRISRRRVHRKKSIYHKKRVTKANKKYMKQRRTRRMKK